MTDATDCSTPRDDSLALLEARARIEAAISPLSNTETCAVGDALHRVLAADTVAPMPVPQHRNSAMDGFAFRHTDTATAPTTTLRPGQSLAGHPFTGQLETGAAIRIMTGAVVPEADNAVVQERVTHLDQDTIQFAANAAAPGQFVRGIGDDIAQGGGAQNRNGSCLHTWV